MKEPRIIGGYAVRETLAEGPLTAIHRAEEISTGRSVIVKARRSAVLATSPAVAALEREARALGSLAHEAIARLFTFVSNEAETYLVIEDTKGERLSDLLRRRSADRSLDAVIALALAIANGVAHAHARGVVHGALDPSQVIVTAEGAIAIYGFASDKGDRASIYLAPEQVLDEPVTARSDVWAIGVMLYEALAGAPPFGEGAAGTKRARLGAMDPLPSRVPRTVASIVARALQPEPEARFEDARALAEALSSALAAETSEPVASLIRGGIARSQPSPREDDRASAAGTAGLRLGRLGVELAIVLGLMIAGTTAITLLADREDARSPGVVSPDAKGSGAIRVVASPWAEVYVDGDLAGVTPMGKPIPVAPGRHYLTFKHPKAPDEAKTITVAAGQTVFIDVTMRIERDAGVKEAGPAVVSP